jgi:hypothetical protein
MRILRAIGDLLYALSLMAFEIVLFIRLLTSINSSLGFAQPLEFYLGIAIFFIFFLVAETPIPLG